MKNVYATEPITFGGEHVLPIRVQATPEQYITKDGVVKVSILGIPLTTQDKISYTIKPEVVLNKILGSKTLSRGNSMYIEAKM